MEFATKLFNINNEKYIDYIGIVNDKGVQELILSK